MRIQAVYMFFTRLIREVECPCKCFNPIPPRVEGEGGEVPTLSLNKDKFLNMNTNTTKLGDFSLSLSGNISIFIITNLSRDLVLPLQDDFNIPSFPHLDFFLTFTHFTPS